MNFVSLVRCCSKHSSCPCVFFCTSVGNGPNSTTHGKPLCFGSQHLSLCKRDSTSCTVQGSKTPTTTAKDFAECDSPTSEDLHLSSTNKKRDNSRQYFNSNWLCLSAHTTSSTPMVLLTHRRVQRWENKRRNSQTSWQSFKGCKGVSSRLRSN